MITENWDITEIAVRGMGDQIVSHLQTIEWEDSPPELWNFVATLPSDVLPFLCEFRECIAAIIGEQVSFIDHRLGLPVNRVRQIAHLFATPAAKFVDCSKLPQSDLFSAIAALLDSDTPGSADIAMLCLKNIFENINPNGARQLFEALCASPIIEAVLNRFACSNLTFSRNARPPEPLPVHS